MAFRILVGGSEDRQASDLLVRASVEAVLVDAGVGEAEISIALLDDKPIRALNRNWLDHDWVPDVLSFALHGDGESPVGDIYIGLEQAARQAADHGVMVDEELVRLAVHGTLHVLGGEHPDSPADRKGSAFFERQESLVSRVMRDHGRHGAADAERNAGEDDR